MLQSNMHTKIMCFTPIDMGEVEADTVHKVGEVHPMVEEAEPSPLLHQLLGNEVSDPLPMHQAQVDMGNHCNYDGKPGHYEKKYKKKMRDRKQKQ